MLLTVVHGDIEDAEMDETLHALRAALDGLWTRVTGTNDTTTWHLIADELPPAAEAVLGAACETYPWWRVTRA